MNTSFRSTLIAATSAALLALAPSAFAAGVTAPPANSAAIHHETVTGEHQAKGTQTAENTTNKSAEMNTTGKMKTETSPEANSKTSAEHPSTMAENSSKMQATPDGTSSSPAMNKTSKTTEHSVAPNNSTAKHGAETGASSTHKAKL